VLFPVSGSKQIYVSIWTLHIITNNTTKIMYFIRKSYYLLAASSPVMSTVVTDQ